MRIPLPSVGAELFCSSQTCLSSGIWWSLLRCSMFLSGALWPDPMPACLEGLFLLLPGLVAAAAAAQAVCCSVPEDGWLLSVMAPYSSTGEMPAVLFGGLCWLEILQETRVKPGAGGACPPHQPILSASSTQYLAVGLSVSLLE